jgi:hypothetical protein
MFVSTKDTRQENRKAEIKNYNLPILQELYHGKANIPLHCVVTNKPAFSQFPCLITGNKYKVRFDIDFNHIRQKASEAKHSGISVDKANYEPSAIFREKRLDQSMYDLVEFLVMMPVSSEIHSFISQDSQVGNITLSNFNKKYYPWCLKNEKNWIKAGTKYGFDFIPYQGIIDHLNNINSPSIRNRIYQTKSGYSWR